MEVYTTGKHLASDVVSSTLIHYLEEHEKKLNLNEAQIYYDFPLYKDFDGEVVISKVLIVSRRHGVIAIGTLDAVNNQSLLEELKEVESNEEQVFSFLYSRLIRNKNLRKTKTELMFPTDVILFAPLVEMPPENLDIETTVLFRNTDLEDYLKELEVDPIPDSIFDEITATLEGAKGLIRPKSRDVLSQECNKGSLANKLESAIASFDQQQKHGYITVLDGVQRIRGLAGSGKTVVLAMKAALTHLRNPNAVILYTFYTRSLYQHIKRLITRFYRQFDDQDPDWSNLHILHAWGGRRYKGVYFNACDEHEVKALSYSEAASKSSLPPFDYACRKLLHEANIQPMYNYIFIDEGQDFPASFLKLCVRLAENNRVVWAYDDLQTIFQPATPTAAEILGSDKHGNPLVELSQDTVLYKCYRNPREILVCAHALGFGLYGPRIVQMLENKEHWEDIGYKVCSDEFVEGATVEIERPIENSLTTISEAQSPDEIVQVIVYDSYADEITGVTQKIKEDIDEGLRPDDILIEVVDDRNAKRYLSDFTEELASSGIKSNNIHADVYSIKDFYLEKHVTLSTVHKAKGNEALMVYVVGVDALFISTQGVRERNILFTAMTRAKGWVRVSGIGTEAKRCQEEMSLALKNFPFLRFEYPSSEQLKIMQRDLAEKSALMQRAERMLDDMSPEDVEKLKELIIRKTIRKKK